MLTKSEAVAQLNLLGGSSTPFSFYCDFLGERWCIENPVSLISSRIRKPDQIIQPWEYGHGEVKATCLWLNNLPRLKATNCVEGREPKVHMMPPGPDRWKERSRTFEGVAAAMGDQWGAGKLPVCTKQGSLFA